MAHVLSYKHVYQRTHTPHLHLYWASSVFGISANTVGDSVVICISLILSNLAHYIFLGNSYVAYIIKVKHVYSI